MTTAQDFDRLSAYLDNQLLPAEKARLEARMEREPELKATLDDLRMTVRALRSLPTVKPPRNFTLTPELARAMTAPQRAFPALRLATALAALAFVVVVVGDFATTLNQAAAPAPAAAPAAVAEKSSTATEAPPTEAFAQGAESAASPTSEISIEALAATPSAADVATDTSTPAAALAAPAAPAPTETAEANSGARASVAPTPTPETVANAAETESFAATGYTAPASDEAQNGVQQGLPPLRYLAVGLAVLTVLLALAAWFWRGR